MNADGGRAYECPRCGKFILSHHMEADLQTYIDAKANGKKEEKIAILSHSIRKMQKEEALRNNLWVSSQAVLAWAKQFGAPEGKITPLAP